MSHYVSVGSTAKQQQQQAAKQQSMLEQSAAGSSGGEGGDMLAGLPVPALVVAAVAIVGFVVWKKRKKG